MKNIVVNYKVLSNKINNKNFLVLSDLHNCTRKKSSDLIDSINELNPDSIFIAGDILSAQKYIKGSLNHKKLKDFLRSISENSPVFLGLGNHDLCGAKKENYLGYKDLETAREGKVFPLNNESIVYKDLRITELHPNRSAFIPSIYESGNSMLQFCDDFYESDIKIPNNDSLYNVLICHDPKVFSQARSVGEQLKFDLTFEESRRLMNLSQKMGSFDMVASGHMHNGFILTSKVLKNPSKYMDKGFKECPIEKDSDNNIKFIRPVFFKKTDMCRGTIFVGETEKKVIELCNGTYYLKINSSVEPEEISEENAYNIINSHKMIPIIISGGVNKYFNVPLDSPEITQVKILKK